MELVKSELAEYAQGIQHAIDDCACDSDSVMCIYCQRLSFMVARMRLLMQVLQMHGEAKS